MIAGALARELGIDVYRVDLSKVMSKWIGETERCSRCHRRLHGPRRWLGWLGPGLWRRVR
jgi:hypothetical protein